ncbi:MOB kinase activator-like 2 [Planococcus citri]|uniref:MOB kinase activator-like 2 n=1 Tax=Planococcus citri TaxID=170843 RepID=UPI0031F7DB7C
MYGTISEFCTATGCPDMVGPGFRTYLWFDDKGKKTRVSAPQYVDYVMTFTQKTINDEGVFPTKYPHEFPSSFETIVRKILRLLFHVLAHLYHSHFREMVMLNLHSHLNSVFTHLILLNDCYHLIDDRELEILYDLVQALKILENDAVVATKSSETSRSSVTNGCLSSDNSADKQVEASTDTSASVKSSEQLASFSDPNSMLPATGNVATDATSATEVVNFSC